MAKTALQITQFDRVILKQLNADLITTVTAFAAARGLEVIASEKGGGSYYPKQFKTGLTLQFDVAGSAIRAAKAETLRQEQYAAARAEYIKSAASYGMKAEWLDKDFFTEGSARSFCGTYYKVIGIQLGGRYPVLVEKEKNKSTYTMPAAGVIKRFEIMAANRAAHDAREAAAKAKAVAPVTPRAV